MRKRLTFLLFQISLLAGVIITEIWANKYVSNVMVLIKAFAAMQTVAVWATIGTFSLKVPSQPVINNAIEITREDPPSIWRSAYKYFCRTIIWISVVTCLTVGQWFLFLVQLLFVTGLMKLTKSAANYLKHVKLDMGAKKAVIDVETIK